MSFFETRYKKLGHPIQHFKLEPCIRINTLKTEVKPMIKRLIEKGFILKKVPFLKNGFYCDAPFSAGATQEYLQGYYYLQEAASQAAAEVLNPKPGENVLDMCAAPGSKTTHIAQLMKNEGNLIALDSNMYRLDSLKNNVERMGCNKVVIFKKDAKFADDLEMEFDRILLDAPCSGNYIIEPNWVNIRDLDGIEDNAREQKRMISTAISILKTNGVLVYSTCSLEPEENEEVIEYALDKFDVKLESTNLRIKSNGITERTKLCKRFWPDETHTQGFFIAKLKKLS